MKLKKVKITGFKSIPQMEVEIDSLNAVIGSGGSGKSNFIDAFRLLERILTKNLQLHVASNPSVFLFGGTAQEISMDFSFDEIDYGFTLKARDNSLFFYDERINSHSLTGLFSKESNYELLFNKSNIRPSLINTMFGNLVAVYRFNDMSENSPIRGVSNTDDVRFFRHDGSNLASYLSFLQKKHPEDFAHIEDQIRKAIPFFDGFVLSHTEYNQRRIKLKWKHKEFDHLFDSYSLPDGMLRFICLVTVFLQPCPPKLILIDDPELSLDQASKESLAALMKKVSNHHQVIIATKSNYLANNCENIITMRNDCFEHKFSCHRIKG